MKEEKLDLQSVIEERNRITWCFGTPLELTRLLATDKTDHRSWMEKAYKGMLHDAGVVDECCRRFEKEFS